MNWVRANFVAWVSFVLIAVTLPQPKCWSYRMSHYATFIWSSAKSGHGLLEPAWVLPDFWLPLGNHFQESSQADSCTCPRDVLLGGSEGSVWASLPPGGMTWAWWDWTRGVLWGFWVLLKKMHPLLGARNRKEQSLGLHENIGGFRMSMPWNVPLQNRYSIIHTAASPAVLS